MLLASASVGAGTADISWSIPTEREDGSALSSDEIQGYYIYWQKDGLTQTPIFIDSTETTHSITDLDLGNYLFWMNTVDSDGNEGNASRVISAELVQKAKAPIRSIEFQMNITLDDGEEFEVIYR